MQPQVSASASRESETLRLEEDMVHHVARPANGYRLQSALLRKGVRSASKDESMAYLYLVLSMLFKVAVISYCIFSLFKLVYPLIYQIQRIIADFLHHMDGKKDEFLFLTA